MFPLFFSYLTGRLASGIISVVATFFMTHLLSTEDFGAGMLYVSMINLLFFLCNLGMDQVFIRYFYEPAYQADTPLLLARCLVVVFCSMLLTAIGILLAQQQVLQWLKLDDPLLIPSLIAGMALFTLMRFLQLIARLREKARVYNLANFFNQLVFLILFLTLYFAWSKHYESVIIGQLVAMACVVLGLGLLYRQELFGLKSGQRVLERSALRAFLAYGTPSLFSLSLTWLFVNLDKFFVLRWSNYYELGIYTAAFTLTAPLTLMQSTFNTAWAPRMTQMLIHKPFKAKREFYHTFQQVNFGLACLFLLLVLGREYIVLFLGVNFHAAVSIFPWLLFAPYFRSLSEIVFAGTVKSKKSYYHVVFSTCAVGINTLGCWLLIPTLGAEGAALSVALSYAAFFIARWVISFRYYQFKIHVTKLCGTVMLLVSFNLVCRYQIHPVLAFALAFALLCWMERSWLWPTLGRHVSGRFPLAVWQSNSQTQRH